MLVVFFFQAEDGIRDLVRSRGLGDVYKRQGQNSALNLFMYREIFRRDDVVVGPDTLKGVGQYHLSLIHI